MGDHVVELAGDALALLGDGLQRCRLLLDGEPLRPLLGLPRVLLARGDEDARSPEER